MTEFYEGQVVYQDLLEPKTFKVGGAVNIKRGMFCTMNANGYLIPVPSVTGKPCYFGNGLFQALQNADNTVGAAGLITCQVACVRSRIMTKLDSGITNVVIGEQLQTKNATQGGTPLVAAAATKASGTVIGTILEFPGEPDKIISVGDDLVVVDLGIGVF